METAPKGYEGPVRISANAGRGPVLSPRTQPHYILTVPDRNFYDRRHCRDTAELDEEDRVKLEELIELTRLALSDEELARPKGRQYISGSRRRSGQATELFGAGEGELALAELVVRENSGLEHSYFSLEFESARPNESSFRLMFTPDGGICEQEVLGLVPLGSYTNPFDRAINLVQQM
jgi:hypothetical protein